MPQVRPRSLPIDVHERRHVAGVAVGHELLSKISTAVVLSLIGVLKRGQRLNAEDLDERLDSIHVVVIDQLLQNLRLAEVFVLLQQFGHLTGARVHVVTACLQDRSVEISERRATRFGHVTAGEAQVSLGHALGGTDGEFGQKCLSFEHGIFGTEGNVGWIGGEVNGGLCRFGRWFVEHGH